MILTIRSDQFKGGGSVSSTAFIQAAEVQSKALGYDPTIVWVPHPIQDRTDAELHELADNTVDEIIAGLTASA